MMTLTRGLVLASVVLIGAGCARQDEILASAGKLGKLSADTRATVKSLALDVNQSCLRMVALGRRFDSLVTFTEAGAPSDALAKPCKDRAKLSAQIAANAVPVFDYLDAVAALGSYQPPTIDTSKAFEALGVNKNATNAYSQIAQFISENAGKRFRVAALRDTIPQQDGNFQTAVADLQSAFGGSCTAADRGSYLAVLAIEEKYAQDTIFNLFVFTATPAKRPKPVVRPCDQNGPAPAGAAAMNAIPGSSLAFNPSTAAPPAPPTIARAIELATFDKYNSELTTILAKTEAQRQASLALAGALYNIAFAHEQLARLLANRPPPCGASLPDPTGGSAPSAQPTPKCDLSTEIIARRASDEKIAYSAESHLQAAIDQVRAARQLLALNERSSR